MKSTNVLLLILLALCWGPSFFFIKIILEEVPVFTLVSLRLTIASLILYSILRFQKKKISIYLPLWKHFVVMGFFASALPFCLITFAETFIPSSLAGIVNGSPPIFTAILAHYFLTTEKMTLRKIFGIILGFTGIVIVFFPSALTGLSGNSLGIFCVAIASISYSIGMVYARRHLSELPNLVAPTFQVMMGALMVVPLSLIFNQSYAMALPSPKVITCIFSLAILGTVLSFTLYYAIMKKAGATYLSTATLLFPFVSIFLGVTFLKETLYWNDYAGCLLILIGLIITNQLISWKDMKFIFKVWKNPPKNNK